MDRRRNSGGQTKIPFRSALIYVVLSAVITWGVLFSVWRYKKHQLHVKQHDPSYNVVALIQTTRHSSPLKSQDLAELMGLSRDKASNLYALSYTDLTKKLQACPVIKWAKVRPMKPRLVHVEYETREPIAHIADFENIVIDKEGFIFPLYPFYTPRVLPSLYLGITIPSSDRIWETQLSSQELFLAFDIMGCVQDHAKNNEIQIVRIDCHKAFHVLQGQREIVVELTLSWKGSQFYKRNVILRFSTSRWNESLREYLRIAKLLRTQNVEEKNCTYHGYICVLPTQILDFRTPQLILMK